ncbi:single-stranded-DNA-specific exonuclease RecJ [Perlabentimonas gracilis]|jgi:single-stranded-DNA-specific exonuclease|uniref:single-stranded-DNA-specific exonuclease RecJ n=1 Tax=Perlabentimonas gracilis TaxID=2715279 RepID=UPI0014087F26|nr:single-stranded-DNA-specific exonuclease RecJ [Perlabentimonas gracilis]
MKKRWNYKEAGNPSTVEGLMNSLGIDRILANLLAQRGIETYEQAKKFFRPALEDLYDPFLMKGMQEAVARIEKAIAAGEKILVYGDYDVDGTTAVALVYSFLRKYVNSVATYIPDRYSEGYGISYTGIDFAIEQGYSLVIALDCGIKAVEKVEYAQQKGVDFIICDHHLPGDSIPKAAAVLDPKQPDCNYPFKELSGCGVGFKLMQGFCQVKGISPLELYPLLDLVAVSIASDIVPVIDENRILTHFGLKQLNNSPSRGLKAIIKLAGIEKHTIAIDDIVFRIGPRINAAGRMESGNSAVDLLCAKDDSVAFEMGSVVNSCNNDRKFVDRSITHEALRLIATNPELQNKKTTVLFNPEWHKGVVGIVASRLIETYYRPTVVLTESNGLATGSARSVPGFDLYQAVEACSDLLENFGGHMYAAGLTMKVENVPEFIERFDRFVSERIKPEMLVPQIDIDAKLNFGDIDDKFYRILKQFQPFGPGNMSPVFVTDNVYDTGDSRLVGNERDHLKLSLIQEDNPKVFQGIAFQMGQHYKKIQKGSPFSVCYSISENSYRGITSIQLRVKDIQYLDELLDEYNDSYGSLSESASE